MESILNDIRLICFADIGMNVNGVEWLFPLVTFFEFVEGLTDDQTADAVRTRIDWKYALHLRVNPPGFHKSFLCDFRRMVVVDPVSRREFQKLVDRLVMFNPPVIQSISNYEIVSLLSGICLLNRLSWTSKAMEQALGALAVKQPEWLREVMLPHWYARFGNLSYGTKHTASMQQNETALAELSADIQYLLEEVQRSNLNEINEMREIKTLRFILEKQFGRGFSTLLMQNETLKWNDCDSCKYFAS